MTQTQTQPAGQVLDPDSAYALVHQRVYAPVFFEKLANDYGLRPNTDEERFEMLTMAAQLRQVHDQEHEKQASQGTSLLAGARAHLNGELAKRGIAVAPSNDHAIKQAAARAARDPELAHAVLTLQAMAAGLLTPQAAAA